MLFVDSCHPEAVQEIFAMGIASGVTTNPLLLAKRAPGPDRHALLLNLANASKKENELTEIFVQLVETDESSMIREAQDLRALFVGSQNDTLLGIKVPFSEVGLRVAHRLANLEFTVNVTSIMSPAQACLAARSGASHLSVFMGRIQDMGYDSTTIIRHVREDLARSSSDCALIVGSIRQPRDVISAFRAGAHIVTASPEILRKMLHNPQTDAVNAEFQAASKTP